MTAEGQAKAFRGRKPGRRYNRVSPKIWSDAAQAGLSDNAKVLLYLLSCSHRTTEGLFKLHKPYIEADLCWTRRRLSGPFAELETNDFIMYDKNVSVILLKDALLTQRPENENQRIYSLRKLEELPATPLFKTFAGLCELYCEPLYHDLVEWFPDRFDEPLPKPLGEPSSEPLGQPQSLTQTQPSTQAPPDATEPQARQDGDDGSFRQPSSTGNQSERASLQTKKSVRESLSKKLPGLKPRSEYK